MRAGSGHPEVQQINGALSSIVEPLSSLRMQPHTIGWEDVKEIIEAMPRALGEIWTAGSSQRGWLYSQERITHFMIVLGGEIVGFVKVGDHHLLYQIRTRNCASVYLDALCVWFASVPISV